MKPASDWLKKPSSEKHEVKATAVNAVVPPSTTISHSTPQPPAVASDANVSTLSLMSVGAYEDFAVSITFYVCYSVLVHVLSIEVSFSCRVFGMCSLCMNLFMHCFRYLTVVLVSVGIWIQN